MNKRGILYICHGDKYIKELEISAKSVKKFSPNLPITLFTDRKMSSKYIDDVRVIKLKSVRSKVYYIYDSPYEQTCFLDTDVIADYSIDDIFDILRSDNSKDGYDIGIAHDLARKREKYSKVIPEYGQIPYSFSEVNTGVLVFRKCDEVKELFDMWAKYHKQYYRACPYDQPSFRVSLWKSNVKPYILPVEYNIRSLQNREKQVRFHNEFGKDHMTPRMYHMHHGQQNLEDALKYCKKNHMPY